MTSSSYGRHLPPPGQLQQRDQTVREISDQLMDTNTNGVILTGLPGVGKATLATLVGEYIDAQTQTAESFQEKTWIREIHANDTFHGIATEILRALGKLDSTLVSKKPYEIANILFGAMATTEKSRLLILARFDRFLDEKTGNVLKGYPEIREWLLRLDQGSCRCRILLTTCVRPTGNQDRLREYKAPGVSVDEGVNMLRSWKVMGSEKDMRQVVDHCHGHATALRLLAVYLQKRSITLAAFLVSAEYQRYWVNNTAKEFFKIFFDQLDSKYRFILQGLALYREPIKREIIQKIMNVLTRNATSQQVASANLLQSFSLVESMGKDTYGLHPLIREYVYDVWTDGQAKIGAHVHAAYLLMLAVPKGARGKTIDEVYPMIEAAWHRCQAGQWRYAFDILQTHAVFLDLEKWSEYGILLELCLMLPAEKWQAQPEERAIFFLLQGRIYQHIGELQEARNFFLQAQSFYKQKPDSQIKEAEVLLELGKLYKQMGSFNEAQEQLSAGLSRLNQLVGGDMTLPGARTYKIWADTLFEQGDLKKAEELYEEALKRFRILSVRDYQAEAELFGQRGALYDAQSNQNVSIKAFSEAARLYQQTGDKRGEASMYFQQGKIFQAQRLYEEALREYKRASDLVTKVPDKMSMADIAKEVGEVFLNLGQTDRARLQVEEALHLYDEQGDELGAAEALNLLGRIYDNQSEQDAVSLDKAVDCYEKALKLFRIKTERRKEGWVLYNLGIVYGKKQQGAEAIEAFQKALKAHTQTNDHVAEGFTLIQLGQIYKQKGETYFARDENIAITKREMVQNFQDAQMYLTKAFRICEEKGNLAIAVVPLHDIGVIRANLDPQDLTSLALLDRALELVKQYNVDNRYRQRVEEAIRQVEHNSPDLRGRLQRLGQSPAQIVKDELIIERGG